MRPLAQKIRHARMKRQLTITELAKLSKLSQPYISDIERGNKTPSAKTMMRIAAALHIPGEFLLRDDLQDIDEFVVAEALRGKIDDKRYLSYIVIVNKAIEASISPLEFEAAVDILKILKIKQRAEQNE